MPSIRNCTGCHGTGAQGYTVAPRLAGQRALYIECQPRGYAAHVRDNPLSKQYMWSAAANLDTDAVRDLADYFASLPPRSAHDGRRALVERGQAIYLQGIRKPISWHASPATARPARVCARFRVTEECPISTSSAGSRNGAKESFGGRVSDAPGCRHAGPGRNRSTRVIPQLRQVSGRPKVRLWREIATPRGRCSRRFGTFEDLTAESE